MSDQTISRDTHNAISSPGSASGHSLFGEPDGQTTVKYGPVPALASLSARQAKEQGLLTSGTYGPLPTGSSNSADPPLLLGEQVASKDGLGWLDLVQADLEGTGYASGAVDLCAAGVGAPHIRQRLWWIGERLDNPAGPRRIGTLEGAERSAWDETRLRVSREGRGTGRLGHADGPRTEARLSEPLERQGRVADVDDDRSDRLSGPDAGQPELGGLADATDIGRVWRRPGEASDEPGTIERSARLRAASTGQPATGPTNGHWRDADWLFCRDGKWRPVEPGTFPLAHGAPARVGRLRAYGNAIVADAAQAFIEAYLDTIDERFRLTEVSLLSPAEDVFS